MLHHNVTIDAEMNRIKTTANKLSLALYVLPYKYRDDGIFSTGLNQEMYKLFPRKEI